MQLNFSGNLMFIKQGKSVIILISNRKCSYVSDNITFVKIKGFLWHGTESDNLSK